MTELLFRDSWRRLAWVKQLVTRATEEVLSMIEPNKPSFDLEVRDAPDNDRFSHARFSFVLPVTPDNVTFLVSDIATNARSCLDMAVHEIVDTHGLTLSRQARVFPIETAMHDAQRGQKVNPTMDRKTKQLLDVLPAPFVQVISNLQPQYSTPYGRFAIPSNVTALWIREISNANKHRNVDSCCGRSDHVVDPRPPWHRVRAGDRLAGIRLARSRARCARGALQQVRRHHRGTEAVTRKLPV